MSILSTNQKLIKVGQDYSAGENIGIYEHTISSRNWSPDITYAAESAFQRATGYTDTQINALSGEVSSEVSQLGSDIDYISGVALTSHQSLEGYLTKASGDEYYQPIGSYATVSQLESTSGEIVNLIPTDYVSNETLEQTSGNIVNLIPDTSEFITNASAEQTYQPIGNYLSSNALEGYATQDWVQDQGYLTGVSIPESATWQDVSTTVQTNSAQWAEGGAGDEEVNSFVYNNSATIKEVNTSYQTNSGTFLTAAPADMATTGDIAELAQTVSETYQTKGDYLVRSDSANFYPANNPSSFTTEEWVTAQGYITGVDLSEYAERDFVLSSIESATSSKLDVSSFASVSSDFLTTSFGISESAHWEEATNAYEQNSGTYLTAVDLTPYQTIEGMTAYQPAGSYATTNELEQVSADITATIPSTAGLASESYVQTNSAVLTGMIDGKQDTLTFGYDEQDRINSINSSALAGGGDVPEDVMVESAIGYNAVNEISGYNGSAIAQYGAEKQWLVHDDTLVHAANSAQYALGVNLSAVAQLLGVDETVLWSGTITTGQTATLSENISAFNKVQCYVYSHNGSPYRGIITLKTDGNNIIYGACDTTWSNGTEYSILRAAFSGNMVSAMQSIIIYNGQNIAQNETITKVIGIGRKQ